MREKPPVLSGDSIDEVVYGAFEEDPLRDLLLLRHYVESRERWDKIAYIIAQTQRDADLKWLREEIEKKPNRYLITGTSGQGQPIYFTGPHTDAQIEAYETCRQDVLSLLGQD